MMAAMLVAVLCLLMGAMPASALTALDANTVFEGMASDPGQIAYIGNCKSFINLRDGPSTDDDILTELPLGTQLLLVQWNREGNWCKVIYDKGSRAGWVFGDFIVLDNPLT